MAHKRTSILLAATVLMACKHQPFERQSGDYPENVGKIFISKCAISGCHNQLSYKNAAGLNLSSWDDLFNGAVTGATVIPYRPDFSSLCYFINTDSSLGISLRPTMPFNLPPLSRDEYNTIVAWIASGAPSVSGAIPFADNPGRRKFYVTNRMCDVVTVVDAETLLPMRYVDAGVRAEIEFPYCVKVTPDRRHWYLSFFSPSTVIQRFDAADDSPAGILDLPAGIWTSFYITADSKYGYFVDNSFPGQIVHADLEKMRVLYVFSHSGKLRYPTGIVVNEQLRKIYIGASSGNFIYSIDISDATSWKAKEVPIDGSMLVQHHPMLHPSELISGRTANECLIACERSGEIKLMNMVNDQVAATIALGANPSFMALSGAQLLVTCPDDTLSFSGNRGSVKIVELNTLSVIRTIRSGYQPYGIAADKTNDIAVVVNANISSKGPSSHHSSRCGTKNGNLTFIDLKTLTLIPGRKAEVAVYPFGAAFR